MKSRALFLDRDGVINKTIRRLSNSHNHEVDDSPMNNSELKFVEGIKEVVAKAKTLGYKILIITNQPSVLNKNFSLNDYESITTEICTFLGLKREDVFECLHKESLCLECGCRKPKPGLFLMASGFHNIDLSSSIMVGDSWKDIYAAKTANVGTTVFLQRKYSEESVGNISHIDKMQNEGKIPDYSIESINELIQIITQNNNNNSDKLELKFGGKVL